MEIEINHYKILGFQTTEEEGSKLTQIEISKAYRIKALELHPDKRPNDPNAVVEFQQLKSSYEILKDEKARKLFDDLLRVKSEQKQRQSQYDFKRRRMMSDLEERERASFATSMTPDFKVKREEERIAKLFMEEIERIRAKHGRGSGGVGTPTTTTPLRSEEGKSEGLDGEKVLKVSWEGNEDDYSSQKLRDLFKEFGDVEDVVIRSTGSKRRRTKSALVVMANKDAAVSAMGSVCGDLSNPLLVLPLNKVAPTVSSSPFPPRYVEPEVPVASNLVGASYQAKEASILDKLRKAAEKQK
ncbi:Dnaj-like protein [Thalictrum thalictroides]|uniref:Dnaj-like protein n=1 Tax=Thalictrum thalictroides TaxID=46969 RepID=A0A7J6WHZ1_THATH|nr:Dnaj-like protein [Thalictrum thalictroides]